jgi:hypothetical protein
MYEGKMYSSMGDTLKCVDPKTQKVIWEKKLHEVSEKDKDKVDSLTTPPALVNGKAFVGTTAGDVICLTADRGKVHWKVNVGAPILFQPAVVQGRRLCVDEQRRPLLPGNRRSERRRLANVGRQRGTQWHKELRVRKLRRKRTLIARCLQSRAWFWFTTISALSELTRLSAIDQGDPACCRAALAAGLRQAAQARRAKAGSGEARPDTSV